MSIWELEEGEYHEVVRTGRVYLFVLGHHPPVYVGSALDLGLDEPDEPSGLVGNLAEPKEELKGWTLEGLVERLEQHGVWVWKSGSSELFVMTSEREHVFRAVSLRYALMAALQTLEGKEGMEDAEEPENIDGWTLFEHR